MKENYGTPLLYGVIDDLRKALIYGESLTKISTKKDGSKSFESIPFGAVSSCDLDKMRSKPMPRLFKDEFEYIPSPVFERTSKPTFRYKKVPYMSDFLDMDFSKTKTISIMKPVSMGVTTSICDSYYEYQNKKSTAEVEKYMNNLKQKYPDWRG